MKCGHSTVTWRCRKNAAGTGITIQKQNTKMLQYAKCVQNSATILAKMRLAFPPVLLYHKNNEREQKQHPDI